MSTQLRSGADVNNQPITRVASPTNPTDGVNKAYVDALAQGYVWKQPVRVATTTSGTLATSFAAGQTIDGVQLVAGNRILIKDQTDGIQNGIYVVNASGAPTRADDADANAELQAATVTVMAGSTNADKTFNQTANDPVVGTSALVWALTGTGQAYTNGDGLNLSGTAFSVKAKASGGVVVDANGVSIDSNFGLLAKRYATNVPAFTTSIDIAHNLNANVNSILVKDLSTGQKVDYDYFIVDLNTVRIVAQGSVAANAIHISIGA